MRSVCWTFSLLLAAVLAPVARSNEMADCPQSREELNRNKALVLKFFALGSSFEERAARFLTPDYIQHNPRILRMNAITGAKGRDAWVRALEEAPRRWIELSGLAGMQFDKPEFMMAECDLVTAIYKRVLKDPDDASRTYEAWAFETFRVRDGKFAEHWDQTELAPRWMTDGRPAESASK